jgi:hypothetical protein
MSPKGGTTAGKKPKQKKLSKAVELLTEGRIAALLRAYNKDDDLYDSHNGIKQQVFRMLGFYESYLTYHSTQRQHCWQPPNWVDANEAFRSMSKTDTSMVVFWTWQRKLPHERSENTHARGVFIDRVRKLVINYEPRIYNPSDHENAKRRHFNKAHMQFLNKFGNSYRFLTVFGNQEKTWDCEKRVLQFGRCCFKFVLDMVETCPGHTTGDACRLRITAVFKFYRRK